MLSTDFSSSPLSATTRRHIRCPGSDFTPNKVETSPWALSQWNNSRIQSQVSAAGWGRREEGWKHNRWHTIRVSFWSGHFCQLHHRDRRIYKEGWGECYFRSGITRQPGWVFGEEGVKLGICSAKNNVVFVVLSFINHHVHAKKICFLVKPGKTGWKFDTDTNWISMEFPVPTNLYFQCAKYEVSKHRFKQLLWKKNLNPCLTKQL